MSWGKPVEGAKFSGLKHVLKKLRNFEFFELNCIHLLKLSYAQSEKVDNRFDKRQSILEYADLDVAVFRVNVDFPAWSVAALDLEASRLGISRQALIKFWVIEKLDQVKEA